MGYLNINRRFAFKIITGSKWIGLGICHKNVLESLKYELDFEKEDHGLYIISSYGMSFSNLEKGNYNKNKSFKFG